MMMRQAASRLLPIIMTPSPCVLMRLPRVQRRDNFRALSSVTRARLQKMKSAAAAPEASSSAPSENLLCLPESVRRLPRANVYDGPTYAIDIGQEREAHIRFLAVHGCGTRFPVLYGESGTFSVGELESVGNGRPLPAPGGPWRVRLASENEDASSSSSSAAAAAATREGAAREMGETGETADEQPRRGRVVTLDALDSVTGEEMTQLALFDDDLGEQRLYRRGSSHTDVVVAGQQQQQQQQQWSAATAAPRWPEKLLTRLDSRGGVSGDDAVVCVDGRYFVDLIELSAFPTPVLFPHGAWRLSGLGPGLSGDFHTAARAVRGVDAVAALSALAAGAESSGPTSSSSDGGAEPLNEPTGRLTGELPGRGRIQLGGSGGVAGVGRALEAVTRREVKATFPAGPLGLGFAPLDWEWGRGAQVWEVDPGSNAEVAGVRPGMVFTSVGDQDVSTADFADIDAMFDGPRPLTVTFNTYVPGAERLYAVEMAAGEALGALRLQQHRKGEGEKEGDSDDGDDDDGENTSSAAFFTSLYEEPARIFDSSAAVVWREEPSTLFVGDPGSATVVHHDIIGQIELCHVLSGAKLLAAAPWGASSQELLAKAVEGSGGGKREGREQEEEEEEEEGSVLSVPVHRKLYDAERALLSHPGLSVVHARPGDTVAFSSAATHFATNGEGNGPCAAVFHGVLTPASAHVLASHPTRLDPFTEEERQTEGFDGHLTGRVVLQDLLPTGKQVLKAAAQTEARGEEAKAEEEATVAKKSGKTAKKKPTNKATTTATLPRFTVHERGVAGEAAARRRFREAVRRMDAAVKASKTKKKKPKKKTTALGAAPPPWPGASFISVYGGDDDDDDDYDEGNEKR